MSDLQIQIFKNEEFGQVRTIIKDGQLWFSGKDVAEILGYGNPRQAISTHVDSCDKGVANLDTLGGSQELTMINESGLYALIFGSRLESAKRFKYWVTSEVLPSIRQNGGYIASQSQGLEFLQGMLDQMKQQNAEIRQAKEQSQKAIEATQSIRSAIVEEFDNWREDIKHKISVIQKGMNETYQNAYNKLYDALESRAACDLSARVRNGRKRLEESGATKTKVEDYCRMDAIESDTRLKEIFTAIVREYAVKYVAWQGGNNETRN